MRFVRPVLLVALICGCTPTTQSDDSHANTRAFLADCQRTDSVVCADIPKKRLIDCNECGLLWRSPAGRSQQTLIRAFLYDIGNWIERSAPVKLTFTRTVPTVKFVSDETLHSFVPRHGSFSTVAVYLSFDGGFILVRDDLPLDVWTASYLVHEMTHHLQYENGRDGRRRCTGELEPLAYTMQIKWLLQVGQAPLTHLFKSRARYRERCGN